MKRFSPGQMPGAAGLRIVGALNLGGRERIVVVEVGDQWIVVGASPGRVNALAQMPRQHEQAGVAVPGAYAPSATSFSEWLKQTIDKRK
jgi:flagellar protein FliO/FliZ